MWRHAVLAKPLLLVLAAAAATTADTMSVSATGISTLIFCFTVICSSCLCDLPFGSHLYS